MANRAESAATPLRLDSGLWLYQDAPAERIERRQLVRRHLADLVGCAVDALAIVADDRGKPAIAAPVTDLTFSLSTRSGLLAIAVARSRPIGVDLEIAPGPTGILALARDFFTPAESAWLAGLDGPLRQDGFLRLWTAKEAVLKADGRGIGAGLDQPDLARHCPAGRALPAGPLRLGAHGADYAVRWLEAATAVGRVILAEARQVPVLNEKRTF